MRVVIIGAGVVGASVAYALSERGGQVVVLEAARPAAGTTRTSFAWPNANDKLPRAYFDLNAAGLDEHQRLHAALGGDWFQPTGNVEVVTDPARQAYQAQKVERLRAWGYAAEIISEARARELVPDLAPPASATYAHYAREGWVAAPVLTHRLLEAAVAAGADVRFPAPVGSLVTSNGRVSGVVVDGERVTADVVIDCSGPAAARLLEPLGLVVGRQRSPGLLVVAEPMPTCLSRVVHAPGVHLRPDGGGRVLIGSEEVDAALPEHPSPTPDSPACQELLERAQRVMPVLRGARLEAARLGWRPMPADGLSAVGPIAGLAGYYLVFTHSGVTLGPYLGRLVAEEVLTTRPDAVLAPFRPDRLIAAG